MNIQRIQPTNFRADNLTEAMAKIVKSHPKAKIFITENNPDTFSTIKNSIRAGHPTAGDPDFTISIHDYIIKTGEDSYVSDRSNPSKNAAVDGNIYISDKNTKGSTLVALNYPVYKSKVTSGDLLKAGKKYDKLISKTLKQLN